jgi:hypothetical protein
MWRGPADPRLKTKAAGAEAGNRNHAVSAGRTHGAGGAEDPRPMLDGLPLLRISEDPGGGLHAACGGQWTPTRVSRVQKWPWTCSNDCAMHWTR